MSTILKALRRLEEEKARGGAPRPLREEVASGPSERARRRVAPWTLLGALLFGASLGASAWWFWPYERAAEPLEVAAPRTVAPDVTDVAVAPAAPAEAAIPPVAGEQRLEDLQVAPDDLPEDAFESQVEVVQRPPAEPRIAPVEPKPVAAAPAAPERRVAIARRREQARAAAAEAITPPTQVAAPAPSVPSPPVRAAVETPPRPAIARPPAPTPVAARPAPAPALPDDERDWPVTSDWQEQPTAPEPTHIDAPRSAPSPTPPATATAEDLRVKRTQWHPEHARRSAEIVLAGKDHSVREGDVVGDYVVNEIKPSGVVLTRDGEQVERGVGAK